MNGFFLLTLFILASIVSFFLLKIIIFLWKKWKLLDRPHLYKSEQGRDPAPYSAGLLVYFTLLVLSPIIYIFGDFNELLLHRLTIVLVIGGLLNMISFIDDMDTIGKSLVKVPPVFRLGMQILIGAIIGITSFKIAYISNIFGGIFRLDDPMWQFMIFGQEVYILPMIITIIWYVLIFNAVNFSD